MSSERDTKIIGRPEKGRGLLAFCPLQTFEGLDWPRNLLGFVKKWEKPGVICVISSLYLGESGASTASWSHRTAGRTGLMCDLFCGPRSLCQWHIHSALKPRGKKA